MAAADRHHVVWAFVRRHGLDMRCFDEGSRRHLVVTETAFADVELTTVADNPFEGLGADRREPISATRPLNFLDQSIRGLREGIREPMAEVGEYLVAPVLDGLGNGTELHGDGRRDTGLPFVERPLCGRPIGGFPYVVEGLFGSPGVVDQRIVLQKPAIR